MPPLTSSPSLLSRLYLSVLCNKIIKEDSALHCGRQRSPQTLETRIPPTRGVLAKFVDHSRALGRWKFLSIRELEEERLEPPAQRAIAELDRTLANDLSWTTSFPGLVDIRAATLREVWDKMDSFSQELHQAVWDVLQNLVRATTRRAQEDRTNGKRQHDRSPPRKFSRLYMDG